MRSRLLAALAAVALAVIACSTVPYTDRTRVVLMAEGEERELGVQAYDEITGKAKLSSNARWSEMVTSVGRKIAAVAAKDLEEDGRDPFEWEFKLIEDKQVNAFCLPGGKIAFYTGIMPICKDENGVAVVMGHEVGHALARHGGERISQSSFLEGVGSILGAVVGGSETTRAAVQVAFGVGTHLAFGLPFSRKHELEADHIGLMLMAQAGYDPRGGPKFWQRMSEASGGGRSAEWLSTHPSHEKRVEELEDLVPDAMPLYEKATGQQIEYHRRVLKAD